MGLDAPRSTPYGINIASGPKGDDGPGLEVGQGGFFFTAPVPAGWLECDGTIYNIATYPELGALLGSKYGGNGTTTFGVPNLQERWIKGRDDDGPNFGDPVGQFHQGVGGRLAVQSAGGSARVPTNNYPAQSSVADRNFDSATDAFGGGVNSVDSITVIFAIYAGA